MQTSEIATPIFVFSDDILIYNSVIDAELDIEPQGLNNTQTFLFDAVGHPVEWRAVSIFAGKYLELFVSDYHMTEESSFRELLTEYLLIYRGDALCEYDLSGLTLYALVDKAVSMFGFTKP